MSVPGPPITEKESALGALRRIARRRPAVESCELCGAQLPSQHQHLIDPAARKILCACDPCAMLFSSQNSARYKKVPREVRPLRSFKMTDAQWDSLMIPIEMAFFLKRGVDDKVSAFYPGPAGAIESLLSLEAWDEIERNNPPLLMMQADVEALLVNRVGAVRGVTAQYYIVPIDECYRLVGLIRLNWHGLSGGTEVWREVTKFFSDLKEKAGPCSEAANA